MVFGMRDEESLEYDDGTDDRSRLPPYSASASRPARRLPSSLRCVTPIFMRALFQTDALLWLLATFFPSSLPIGVPKDLELTPGDRAQILRVMETMLPATSRRDGFLFDMFVSTPTLTPAYPFDEISVPTLVVTAADDPLALPDNSRRLAAAIPNARLVEVDRGGHLLVGQAEVVEDEVRRFIREHITERQRPGPSVAAAPH